MTITFSESTIVGYPGAIPGDSALPNTHFTSYYGNVDFAFEVSFAKSSDETHTYTVASVTHTDVDDSYFLLVESVSSNTLRFTRTNNPFDEETFVYRLRNDEMEVIEAFTESEVDNRPDSVGMIQWNYPDDPKYVLVTHGITVSGVDNLGVPFTESVSYQQYFYWKLEPSLTKFQQLINQEYQ